MGEICVVNSGTRDQYGNKHIKRRFENPHNKYALLCIWTTFRQFRILAFKELP